MDEKKLWTVGELIAKLNEFPPDTLVLYNDSEWLEFFKHLNPTVEKVVETVDGEYCQPRYSDYFKGKRQLEAVNLNSWRDYGTVPSS